MPAKGKLGRPPPSIAPPAISCSGPATVLQNLAKAREHEEPQNTVRAEPVQTQLDATQEQAEPTAPHIPASQHGGSSVAEEDLDDKVVFPLDSDTLTIFAPDDPDVVHGEHVGMCQICKKPVLSTDMKLTWVSKKGHNVRYHKHVDCQKMSNTMHRLLSKGCNGRLKDLWEAEPVDKRVAWWHRHPGLTNDELQTELMVHYSEEITETNGRKRAYKGVPTDIVALKQKYLPDRQEMFDNIIQNANQFICEVTGATLYEDPSYENSKVCTERRTEVKKRTAEQTSTVAPKKALKPNRSHPNKYRGELRLRRAERGTEEIKNIDAELDEAARQRILDQTTKKKPLTENFKKKLENIGDHAREAMDAFEALQEKLTEVATQILAKSIEILQKAGLDVQSNIAQVDEIICAGEYGVLVHSLFKRASEDTAALKKQTKLVRDLVGQLE